MSRIGKYPVEIPAGVQVALAGRTITVISVPAPLRAVENGTQVTRSALLSI